MAFFPLVCSSNVSPVRTTVAWAVRMVVAIRIHVNDFMVLEEKNIFYRVVDIQKFRFASRSLTFMLFRKNRM